MESLLATLATQHNGKLAISLNSHVGYRVNVLYSVLGQYGEFVAWFADENDALCFVDSVKADYIFADHIEINGREVFHR